jgi:hypothetical protein
LEKGFNSDITQNGITYHIQTEDWGVQNPFIVSRIFRNGKVLRTLKRAYQDSVDLGPSSLAEAVRLAMKEQHYEILDLIYSGQLEN